MKILTNARLKSMQGQISKQAIAIRELNREISRLEWENQMEAERIGELEGLLFGYGIIDRTGRVRLDATDRGKIVNEILDRMEQEDAAYPVYKGAL